MAYNYYFLTEPYRLPGIHECFLLQVHLPSHWHLWGHSTSRHCWKSAEGHLILVCITNTTFKVQYWNCLCILITLEHLWMPIMNISGLLFCSLETLLFCNDTLPISLLVMSSTNNQAPVETICSQLTCHQLNDLSLLVQVAPPVSQIGRQEATAWQVRWLWQHSYQSTAFQKTQA